MLLPLFPDVVSVSLCEIDTRSAVFHVVVICDTAEPYERERKREKRSVLPPFGQMLTLTERTHTHTLIKGTADGRTNDGYIIFSGDAKNPFVSPFSVT